MKNLLKIKLSIQILLVASLTFVNCNNDEFNKPDEFQLDLSNLKLNINFEIGKEKSISKKDISKFISDNYNEILKLDNQLSLTFKCKQGKIYYSVDDKKTLETKIKSSVKKNRELSDPPGFWDDKVECNTCRSEDCVKNTLTKAIGSGDEEIYISVTPNYTLGIQTSITVCYGSPAAFLSKFN